MSHPAVPAQGLPRVVVLGGGFAGFFAAKALAKQLRPGEADVTLVSDTDGMVYQPLLPYVAAGEAEPRDVVVALDPARLRCRVVRAHVEKIDVDGRRLEVSGHPTLTDVPYDHLVLAAGSVTRLFDIDGLADNALGFKTPVEAFTIRDVVLQRLESAAIEVDDTKRAAASTFLVVGAGYAGVELAAHLARVTERFAARERGGREVTPRWLLVDVAKAVLPEIGPELGKAALEDLKALHVDVRLGTTIKEMTDSSVTLTDGDTIDCATVVWTAGVAASPLVATTGLPTQKGRLTVKATFEVDGHPEIFGLGDAAAVPDLTKSKPGHEAVCPPTAQHAMRQGTAVAKNVVRRLRGEPLQDYKHHDLGLVVDLGGPHAVALPVGIKLRGLPAVVVTRGYHVFALPSIRKRLRVLSDWLLDAPGTDDITLGVTAKPQWALAAREHRESD